MKIHVFPPSGRIVGIVALKSHLALDCELQPVDMTRGEQRVSDYVSLNPNAKIPTLEDDGVVLWESNAILFYMASKRPESGVWPSDVQGQADVLRWLFWESAHWDAESCGMVAARQESGPVTAADLVPHGSPACAGDPHVGSLSSGDSAFQYRSHP